MACVSIGKWVCSNGGIQTRSASASLALLTGSRAKSSVSLNAATNVPARSGLLHCSFVPLSSVSLSSSSSLSGLSLGWNLNSCTVVTKEKGCGLVVRAGKAALCQTKRNRSRKSLARTHGFRKRMSTTSGRAILKRRRAKGRWVLCTKSNHNSGKRP